MIEIRTVTPFLQPLIDKLGIKNYLSKAVLAGLVMNTLRDNGCGVSVENTSEVKANLINGVCDEYLFEVADLAGAYGNDLLDILARNEEGIDRDVFYKEHVWPFLRENEVVPGVRLRD